MKSRILFIIKIVWAFIMACLSLYLVKVILDLNIFVTKYIVILIGGLIILNIVGIITLLSKKILLKFIGCLIYGIIFVVSILGISVGNDIIDFFRNAFNNNIVEISTYKVLVLNDSDYNDLSDLQEKTMGLLDSDIFIDDVKSEITDNIKVDFIDHDDVFDLYNALMNNDVSSVLLDEAYLDILEDEYDDVDAMLRVVYSFNIETEINDNNSDFDTLKPINIYLSGSDSRSNRIYNKSRSDVNMIITINPYTKNILLTSIPRDYYVQVYGKVGLKDKLTHSGIYGIGVTVATVEELFDIEIDYSIKVGFSSLIEVVDLIGGIDIYSDKAFTTYCSDGGAKSTEVVEGWNHFDGAEALSYARERHAYSSGDRHRILNQQQVLTAIINKIISDKSILLRYDELLNALSNLYVTNIPSDIITSYIKMQLSDMSEWIIETQSVDGSGAMRHTFTAPNNNRYVMIPYEDDLKKATEKISEILESL